MGLFSDEFYHHSNNQHGTKDVVLPAGMAIELMLSLLSSNTNMTSDIRPAIDLIRAQVCGPRVTTCPSFNKLPDSIITFLCGYLDQDDVLAMVHVNRYFREFICSPKNGGVLSHLVVDDEVVDDDVLGLPKGITLLPSLSHIGKHLTTLKLCADYHDGESIGQLISNLGTKLETLHYHESHKYYPKEQGI